MNLVVEFFFLSRIQAFYSFRNPAAIAHWADRNSEDSDKIRRPEKEMRIKNCIISILLLCSLAILTSCDVNDGFDDQQPPPEEGIFEPGSGEIGPDGRPVGWTDETHGKKADPNYELLFGNSDSEVLRLDIVIAPSDWQAMMDDMTEKLGPFGTFFGSFNPSSFNPSNPWNMTGGGTPIYVPCDLVFKGITWYHAGIRFKGNSSLQRAWQQGSYKMSLRFNMDKFEDDFPEIKNQRFHGFDKLSLVSSNLDDSLIREKVAGDIYRDMGVPVAKTAFCRVFIDYGEGKKYFGFYTLQEIPAKPMLESRFIEGGGNLYKPDGIAASFATWNPEVFDKETNEDEADYSDVRELYDVLRSDRSDEAAFRSKLESIFNVDGFLRYLAVNQVICNWDTYGRIAHNHYLYHDPGDDLIHWIPWDFTAALWPPSQSMMPPLSLELRPLEAGNMWPLIRYLMDIPDYHAKYVSYVKKTVDECFYPERMQGIFASAKKLVTPYVIGTYGEVKGYTNLRRKSDFENEFPILDTHVKDRFYKAMNFIDKYQH
jgi:spore coat protein CotH